MKQYGKVAVMMGGSSAEREISLMSGNGVLNALRSRGVDAHAFDPAEQPLQVVANQSARPGVTSSGFCAYGIA